MEESRSQHLTKTIRYDRFESPDNTIKFRFSVRLFNISGQWAWDIITRRHRLVKLRNVQSRSGP